MSSKNQNQQDDLGLGESLQKPGQAISSMTGGYNQSKQIIQMIREVFYGLLIMFCSSFTMFAEALLHKTHGIRTITLTRFVIATLVMFAVVVLPIELSKATELSTNMQAGKVLTIALLVFLLLISRWRRAWRRFNAGERVYSKATSDPYRIWYRIPFVDSPWIAMRWAEPCALLMIGGIGFAAFQSWLALYIAISGVALLLKHSLTQKQINAKVMDAIDSEIEAQEITAALKNGKNIPHSDTGFIVPIVIPQPKSRSTKNSRK